MTHTVDITLRLLMCTAVITAELLDCLYKLVFMKQSMDSLTYKIQICNTHNVCQLAESEAKAVSESAQGKGHSSVVWWCVNGAICKEEIVQYTTRHHSVQFS